MSWRVGGLLVSPPGFHTGLFQRSILMSVVAMVRSDRCVFGGPHPGLRIDNGECSMCWTYFTYGEYSTQVVCSKFSDYFQFCGSMCAA